jgi:thiosulfate/3-mercaptopyruvate sulfurtransferase
MAWTTLIDTATLATLVDQDDIAIVDCRFLLDDPAWGHREYLGQHIPGAVYAHLNDDLSGPPTGLNGRHPLPSPAALTGTFGRLGIGQGVQVIAYDQDAGMYASRLWWLLRWMGHHAVAVLDGGFAAWRQESRPTESGPARVVARTFAGVPDQSVVATLDEVEAIVAGRSDKRLVDARAPERFRGEVEPIDRAAGHIPGAVNYFFKANVNQDGRFQPLEVLREQLRAAVAQAPPQAVVAYCGSGVTACHNLLAMEHVGLRGARLYPGSWSEWSADPTRPIATGG